jgi:CubicO group peptidase (beta-lactamase class C family)
MNLGAAHCLLVTIIMLVAATGCSPSPAPPLVTTSEPTPAGKPPTDYVALEAEIEKAITTGPATLDNVRAVLVSVDGETKIAHYRHGFTDGDHGHVFSVTKSVISILIGIAIGDGLIASRSAACGTGRRNRWPAERTAGLRPLGGTTRARREWWDRRSSCNPVRDG